MLLPEEEAVITAIDNADDIKNQPFFSQVANGDQVLIFPAAAKIVIYRPSQNVIVNVGPIIDDRASAATPTDSSAVDPSSLAAPVNSDASSTADVN